MIESIVLDILLILIVLLMMAIGAYRGGLREAFSAAGLLLGVLLASEWLDTWGGWIADNTSLSDGGGRFLVAVMSMMLATILVGYGVGSSFNYHPGPGGRMYGLVIAAGSSLVAISYILTWLRAFLFEDNDPSVIGDTYVARFLDGGSGTVLLLVSCVIVTSALFGAFVRERDDDAVADAAQTSFAMPRVRRRAEEPNPEFPEKVEPASGESANRTELVRVRESRQWDDRSGSMPARSDRLWSNTWPSDVPGPKQDQPSRPSGDVQQARLRRKQGDSNTTGEHRSGSDRKQ